MLVSLALGVRIKVEAHEVPDVDVGPVGGGDEGGLGRVAMPVGPARDEGRLGAVLTHRDQEPVLLDRLDL